MKIWHILGTGNGGVIKYAAKTMSAWAKRSGPGARKMTSEDISEATGLDPGQARQAAMYLERHGYVTATESDPTVWMISDSAFKHASAMLGRGNMPVPIEGGILEVVQNGIGGHEHKIRQVVTFSKATKTGE